MDRLEEVARIICCFAKENNSCSECRYNTPSTPFPACFPDIKEETDAICSLFPKPDESRLLDDENAENKLVEEYMATLGWDYPIGKYNDYEDYDTAVKTVKWFLAKTASIVRDKTLKEVESIGEVMNINSRDELVIVYRDWKRLKKGG